MRVVNSAPARISEPGPITTLLRPSRVTLRFLLPNTRSHLKNIFEMASNVFLHVPHTLATRNGAGFLHRLQSPARRLAADRPVALDCFPSSTIASLGLWFPCGMILRIKLCLFHGASRDLLGAADASVFSSSLNPYVSSSLSPSVCRPSCTVPYSFRDP